MKYSYMLSTMPLVFKFFFLSFYIAFLSFLQFKTACQMWQYSSLRIYSIIYNPARRANVYIWFVCITVAMQHWQKVSAQICTPHSSDTYIPNQTWQKNNVHIAQQLETRKKVCKILIYFIWIARMQHIAFIHSYIIYS